MDKSEIRVISKYEFLCQINAAQTARNISEIFRRQRG